MSNGSEKLLVKAEENGETARQENAADADTALVELGKVSNTQGGWFGAKNDSGAGLVWV